MASFYHYTDIGGLIGILQYRKLWLSSVNNMNDHQEVVWLRNKFASRLSELVDKSSFSDKHKELIDSFWQMMSHPYPTPYICCFSKNGDLLSQWRAYSSDGEGACIKFSGEALGVKQGIPYMHPQVEYSMRYADVVYVESDTQSFITEMLGELVNIVEAIVGGDNDKMIKLSELANHCSRASYIFKNPAFSEEQEIRIIHTPFIDANNDWFGCVSDVKFRQCVGSITSYFEYEFPVNAIDEIILGPKSRCSVDELNLMLRVSGYKNVKISRSSASYR
ncbi:TPA: DUF2971 domain-containing protein [Vibrio diabolicus]